jgi:hypothetical protein
VNLSVAVTNSFTPHQFAMQLYLRQVLEEILGSNTHRYAKTVSATHLSFRKIAEK